MTPQEILDQANIRISILERQRNDAMNQTLNALTEMAIVNNELEGTRAALRDSLVQNTQLAQQLNTQADELERLRQASRPRKRKTDG